MRGFQKITGPIKLRMATGEVHSFASLVDAAAACAFNDFEVVDRLPSHPDLWIKSGAEFRNTWHYRHVLSRFQRSVMLFDECGLPIRAAEMVHQQCQLPRVRTH